jgi:fermentation-respiration switch protein FrsA (DUF1100 family)
VLAVEYPGEIPEALELGELVRRFRRIRATARQMPALVRGAGHWLAGVQEVDPHRVALVGVSFGVPFAAPAGRDPVFRGVALLYGGADLALLFRTHLPVDADWLRRPAARLLAALFRDLEPGRHVGRISPRPLLLINGIHDDWVPAESARRLRQAARPPVRQVWVDHGHLMPWHFDVMREMADSTLSHFEFLPDPPARRPAGRTGLRPRFPPAGAPVAGYPPAGAPADRVSAMPVRYGVGRRPSSSSMRALLNR